ncbi:FecR family protein [uncultured Muribaculum sp.]|uniref:FecR family protein n=1 Tax=uncultured Muribaculum sp. TaxID=1918613 RepID=UPI0025CD4DEA|nr:FecR domain-containing protein [uncultured Muribaculum sp.]
MHDLIHKYKENKLSAEEIGKLRELLDGMSDDELSAFLEKDWEENGERRETLPEDVSARLRKTVWASAGLRPSGGRRFMWIAACCAVMALCLFAGYAARGIMVSGGDDSDVVIAANETGGTDVTFSDGSEISMRPHSSIGYSEPPTSDGERSVRFAGTGHFRIAKGCRKPFTVASERLDVTVLGTDFYLSAEPDKKTARLYLQEGLVQFKSKLSGESVEMHPGNLAVLDYATGKISVTEDSTLVDVFRMSDSTNLNYVNTSLGSVVESLNTCYAPFHITLSPASLGEMKFTGNLPGNNLMEALSVLEYTASLKISVRSNEIVLRN